MKVRKIKVLCFSFILCWLHIKINSSVQHHVMMAIVGSQAWLIFSNLNLKFRWRIKLRRGAQDRTSIDITLQKENRRHRGIRNGPVYRAIRFTPQEIETVLDWNHSFLTVVEFYDVCNRNFVRFSAINTFYEVIWLVLMSTVIFEWVQWYLKYALTYSIIQWS